MRSLFRFALVSVLIIASFLVFTHSINAESQEKLAINLFWGEGCPHCAKEKAYLAKLLPQYEDRIIYTDYEIYYHFENSELFINTLEQLKIDIS